MFYLFTKRVWKTAVNTTEKFAARTTTHVGWEVSGPFATDKEAKRAMQRIVGTHTCVSCLMLPEFMVMNSEISLPVDDHGLFRVVCQIRKSMRSIKEAAAVEK